MKRSIALSLGLAGCLAMPTIARAQTAPPVADAPLPDGPLPDAAGQASDGIGDIIVTASRRAESAQTLPAAVTAVGGDDLLGQGIVQPQDLSKMVAGLSLSPNGGTTQLFLRGVGTYSVAAFADSAIAFSVDGVFYGFPTALSGSLYDLDRVEVLKGPQGTLYGRNATAGAINVITNKPAFSNSVDGSVEGGNYGLFKANLAVNVKASDTVALRGAGQFVRRNGYFSDGYGNDKSEFARLQALIEPNDDLSLLIGADYSHVGGMGSAYVPSPQPGDDPWEGPSTATSNRYITASGLPIPTTGDDGFVDNAIWNLHAETNYRMGFATLTAIVAHQWADSDQLVYPGFSFGTETSGEQTSVELRLASAGEGPLKWLVGVYGFGSSLGSTFDIDQGLSASQSDSRQTVRAFAGFGEATYAVLPALRLTGGLRYTTERRTQSGVIVNTEIGATGSSSVTGSLAGQRRDSNVSWKAAIDYDLAPRSLAYASVSTGFKAGGLNLDTAPNGYEPEKLTAYALGVKNRFLDNTLQLNLELFYWDYRNHQESFLIQRSAGGFFVGNRNLGKSYATGANVDLVFEPTANDRISVQAEYLRSRYQEFSYQLPAALAPTPGVTTECSVSGVGLVTIDCSGKPFVRAPEWSGTIGYAHTFDLAGGAAIIADLRSQLSTGYYFATDYTDYEYQGAYTSTDLNLTYASAGKHWSVTAFVRNLEKSAIYEGGLAPPYVRGVVYATLRAPRTVGARLNVGF